MRPASVNTIPNTRRIGQRMAISIKADCGLQQCACDLENKGYDANLGEVEGELALQNRIDCRNKRLDRVVA